jgi:hypothetical protein
VTVGKMERSRSRSKAIIAHAIALKNQNDDSKKYEKDITSVVTPTSAHMEKSFVQSPALKPKKLIDDRPSHAATVTPIAAAECKHIFGGKYIPSKILIDPKVKKIYQILHKSTGALGGNGYFGAIYGELTMHSMQRVTNILVEKCHLNHKSRFIDVGSGLGKPNFHVAQYPAVRLSIGVELEHIRWQVRKKK